MNIRKIILTCICTGLSLSAYAATPAVEVVKDTFAWFNQISSEKRHPFSQQDVAKHFSSDAKMFTNNKLACQGIDGHFEHFIELNQHFKTMQVDINKVDMREMGDRVYLDYTIDSVNTKMQPVKIHIMGYMVVQNRRITLFKEVAAFEEGDKKSVVG